MRRGLTITINRSLHRIRTVIQVLLGHKKPDTTALYSKVATRTIREVKSPICYLFKVPRARRGGMGGSPGSGGRR